MIGKEIRTILLADATVVGLVGSRVYSELGPQTDDTVPQVVYRVDAFGKEHSQDLSKVDLYRIEFDLFASTYSQLQALEDAVDDALDRYAIGAVVGNYLMDGIAQEDSEDNPYDVDLDGWRHKTARYRIRVKDFVLDYSLTEQNTGETWIDGSPVYEITIQKDASGGLIDLVDSGYTVIDFWHTYPNGPDNDNTSPSGSAFSDKWVKGSITAGFWGATKGVNSQSNYPQYLTVRYIKSVLT